ncbi:hypothetical protein PV327_005897 [Microctonus hyperodae]|uniref:Uncharacterized protein n=1 Tax=Microctonus hyperodae TaxID=165561 RepID=A0AA39G2C7_MICHY|nr:hypothetical protein PV327_005897 [Microctonus hyperodae]
MKTSIQQSKLKSDPSVTSPNQDLDWAIRWNRIVLQILGLWTYSEQSLFVEILSHFHTALIALSVFIFMILPQSFALIKVWGSVALVIDNIAMNLPVMTAEFKFLILWYKKKVAFNTVIRTINNITDVPGALFAIQCVYFYDVTPPLIYHLTMVSQIIGTAFASFLYTAVDVLYGLIIAHLCGQLENLSYKLENMTNHKKNFQNVLKIAQQKHCSLIRSDEFSQIGFLLIHAQRPLYITFGKFAPITLNTFAKVLKTSCGWVSVLLAMKN